MDEYFEQFLEELGPASEEKTVPASVIDFYTNRLPDQLLTYWREYGWSGYGRGKFWIVNPKEYEPVLNAWLGSTPFIEEDDYHVIARSAFGDVYFFGARHGRKLHLMATEGELMPPRAGISDLDLSIRAFFASRVSAATDFSDEDGEPLFERALERLGPVDAGQMYGFEPALALGGPRRLGNLKKVGAVEHLVFLAQLTDLRIAKG